MKKSRLLLFCNIFFAFKGTFINLYSLIKKINEMFNTGHITGRTHTITRTCWALIGRGVGGPVILALFWLCVALTRFVRSRGSRAGLFTQRGLSLSSSRDLELFWVTARDLNLRTRTV